VLSRGLGIAGVILLLLGLKDYVEIQEDKNKKAQEMADRIVEHCRQYPYSPVNLVLHSQGADIGARALKLLDQKHRDRIRVVTLGGMVAIADDVCQYVINLKLNHDPVSTAVATPLNFLSEVIDGETRTTCQIWSETAGVLAHGIDDYLEHRDVRRILKTLSQPDCYSCRGSQVIEHWNPTLELPKCTSPKVGE